MPINGAIRKLFDSTVAVADDEPPNMEYRILRQLYWQDSPDVIYTTPRKWEARRCLRETTEYHDHNYHEARVWLEQRVVGNWTEASE